MKLLSLVTVVVLLQVSLISQAAEINKPVAISTGINTETGLQTIGVKKLTKTDWGTTITKRKLHLRDGVFSLTLHSTKLYS